MLLCEWLHQSLPVARRNELHWQAGLLAEASGGDAAACARHLLEGVDAGDAAHAALRTAEQAVRQLAFESAIALGERVRAILPALSLLACQLECTIGEGLLRSGNLEAGTSAAGAPRRSRRLGDLDTLLYVLQYIRAGAAYFMTDDQRFEARGHAARRVRDVRR